MRRNSHLRAALACALLACASALAQAQEKKVSYAVLLDNSGSLRTQFAGVASLGKGVVRELRKHGPVSLFNFKTEGNKPETALAVVTPGTAWGLDEGALLDYIDGITFQPGRTTLYDAVLALAERLDAQARLDKGVTRKVIVLLTDGEDRKSKVKQKELIKELKGRNIQVYAVGFTRELDSQGGLLRQSAAERAKGFLKDITKETGGRALFPESGGGEVSEWVRDLAPPR